MPLDRYGGVTGIKVSDDLLNVNATERTSNSATYEKKKETRTYLTGTHRIKFSLKSTSSLELAYGKVYVNGVAVGTERSTASVTYIEYSEDFADLKASDLIQVYCKHENLGYGGVTSIKDLKICVITVSSFEDTAGY